MHIDFSQLEPRQRYKLMTGAIVPRPIAWVNTRNPDGGCNTAPFSFFNGVADEPPTLMFCVGKRPGTNVDKDTLLNIRRHPEFVVHLCDEDTIEALSFTAGDFPPGVEEIREYGDLTLVPAQTVSVPRIAEAPIAFECRLFRFVDLQGSYTMVIGLIQSMYVRDDLLVDTDKIDFRRYRPVGRLAGSGYAYVRDLFAITRLSYERYRQDPKAERERTRIRPFAQD